MKKTIFTIMGLLIGCNYSFADRVIDLQNEKIFCNKYQLSESSQISDIRSNCKIHDIDRDSKNGQQEYEFEFYATTPHCEVECKFLEDKLTYCKIDHHCKSKN